MKYRADIDGLRAIAVVAVVVFHALPSALPSGFVGVDIFFVISGFLISTIILEKAAQSKFTYSDFYSRRVKRIFPALVFVLGVVGGLGWWVLLPDEFARLGKHILQSTLFLENINLIRESGYFDTSSDSKPLLHLWSLAVEEQFYILWPLILTMGFRRRKFLFPMLGLLFAVSFFINILRVQEFPISTFFEIQSRVWELAAGGILAAVFALHSNSQRWLGEIRNVLSVGGALLLGLGFCIINEDRAFPGWIAFLPVMGTVGLIAAGESGWINSMLLRRTLLVKIGLISYPLYLWHWPLLAYVRILLPDQDSNGNLAVGLRLACVGLSFGLSVLTYRFVEGFFRHSSPGWNGRVVGLILSSLVLGFLGFEIEKQKGFSSRWGDALVERQNAETSSVHPFVPCAVGSLPGVERCEQTPGEGISRVFVIGDSHASAFAVGLVPYFAAQNMGVTVIGSTCTLGLLDVATSTGVESKQVGRRNINAAFEWVLAQKPEFVFLVSDDSLYVAGKAIPQIAHLKMSLVDLKDPSMRDRVQIYEAGLRRTLDAFSKAQVKTVFVLNNPELDFIPKEACFVRPRNVFAISARAPCAIPRQQVEERQAAYRNAVAHVLKDFPQVRVFDPFGYLCDDHFCFARKSGPLLYLDDNHLSPYAMSELARSFDFHLPGQK